MYIWCILFSHSILHEIYCVLLPSQDRDASRYRRSAVSRETGQGECHTAQDSVNTDGGASERERQRESALRKNIMRKALRSWRENMMDLEALVEKCFPKVKAGFSKQLQPCSAGTRGGSCLDYDVHLCICNGMRTAMFDECICLTCIILSAALWTMPRKPTSTPSALFFSVSRIS